jgi:hypothetical protein
MKSDVLEKHIFSTYFTLRIGIAVIAILFPLVLWIGGRIYAGLPLQDSISAYYHASIDQKSMRDWFVGVLFAIGAFLYLYKGYSNTENIVLNCAGVLAVGIAIFPMWWNSVDDSRKFSLHGFCAISFFLCIAFVCIRCASDTLHLIQDENVKRRFKRQYNIIGVAMITSPAMAFVLTVLLQQYKALTFYVEAAGIFSFAAYWLTKSREISITEADRLALQGKLET